jgi:hypothetical protein
MVEAVVADTSTVALVTALSELTPEGRSFAFAPDVDISQPVRRPASSLDYAARLRGVLSSAGLQARDVGTVLFIERAGRAGSDVAAIHQAPVRMSSTAAPVIAAPQAEQMVAGIPASESANPRLGRGTLMNAPVLSPDEVAAVIPPAAVASESNVEMISSDLASATPLAPVVPPVMATTEPPVAVATDEPPARRNWARRSEMLAPASAVSAQSSAEPEQVLARASVMDDTSPEPVTLASSAPEATVEPAAPAPQIMAATPVIQDAPVTETVPVATAQMPEIVPAAGPQEVIAPHVVAAVTEANDKADLVTRMGADIQPQPTTDLVGGAWLAQRGETLRATLQRWSEREGVHMVWRSEYDYPLAATLNIPGDYEGAVRVLLGGFATASPQPFAQLHRQGGTGSRVLVVTSRGNDYAE